MTTPAHPAPRSRRWTALAILGVALLACVAGGFALLRGRHFPPPVPAPDLGEADPKVAAAVREAQEKVRREPRSAEAWGRLGTVLTAHDYHAEAEPCFVEAQRLDPHEPRWP